MKPRFLRASTAVSLSTSIHRLESLKADQPPSPPERERNKGKEGRKEEKKNMQWREATPWRARWHAVSYANGLRKRFALCERFLLVYALQGRVTKRTRNIQRTTSEFSWFLDVKLLRRRARPSLSLPLFRDVLDAFAFSSLYVLVLASSFGILAAVPAPFDPRLALTKISSTCRRTRSISPSSLSLSFPLLPLPSTLPSFLSRFSFVLISRDPLPYYL